MTGVQTCALPICFPVTIGKFFPIMMYAMVMGMSGLTIMYQKATLWLGFNEMIGTVLMLFSTVLFVVISFIYMGKFIKYTEVVKKEFSHPIRLNFFAAISISMLMLAIIYKEVNVNVSALFWYTYRDWETDRKSTRLNSSHRSLSRMPSSA